MTLTPFNPDLAATAAWGCRAITALASVGVCVAAASAAGPIRVERFERTVDGAPIRGWVAEINLLDPTLDIVVTGPPDDGARATGDSRLIATDEWAAEVGCVLAINANFFGVTSDAKTDPRQPKFETGRVSDIIGLCVSDGVIVSPVSHPRDAVAYPSVVFTKDRRARIGLLDRPQTLDAWDAVGGVGATESEPFGSLLVTDGANTGGTTRVEPNARHPRTAVGTDKAGERLWVFVIDGRQPDWSVGATLPELAAWMLERGVYNAVNLDGGGSTSFVHDPTPGVPGDEQKNKPSGGSFRPVANQLGFRVVSGPSLGTTQGADPRSPEQPKEKSDLPPR